MMIFKKVIPFSLKCFIPVLFIVFAFLSCSEEIPMILNDDDSKEIVSFILRAENNKSLSSDISGTINDNSIDLSVPYKTDTGSLVPDIQFIGSTLTPASGDIVDFSNGPVTFTVTASDLTKKDYSVIIKIIAGSEKKITSFKFLKNDNASLLNKDYICNITQPDANNPAGEIEVIVPNPNDPYILEYRLMPEISFNGISIKPEAEDKIDFWCSKYGPVKYTVSAEDKTTVSYNVSVDHTRNSYKDISGFKIYSDAGKTNQITCTTVIDNLLNTIEFKVPYKLSGSVYPEITAAGVYSITPSATTPINLVIDPKDSSGCTYFDVKYLITAQDLTTAEYTIKFRVLLSGENAITSFRINSLNLIGAIDNQNSRITATVPFGTNRTSLTPTIAVSSGATISPASGTSRNFTNPVTYTVTSQSSVKRTWTVQITETQSNQKDITSFTFNIGSETVAGIIDGTTIKVNIMTFGASLNGLAPVITINGVSISPASGVPQNFSPVTPVTYTVRAQDTSTKIYYVYAKVLPRMTVLRPGSDYVKNIQSPSGTHYDDVNDPPETPIGTVDSTYVTNDSSFGATQLDLYNVSPYNPDPEYGTGTVNMVIIKYRARREMYSLSVGDLPGEAWDTINTGGGNSNGPQVSLSTKDYWYALTHEFINAPDGAWNWTKVNNIKIGITLSNHYKAYAGGLLGGARSNVLCSQVYAEVYYTLIPL